MSAADGIHALSSTPIEFIPTGDLIEEISNRCGIVAIVFDPPDSSQPNIRVYAPAYPAIAGPAIILAIDVLHETLESIG